MPELETKLYISLEYVTFILNVEYSTNKVKEESLGDIIFITYESDLSIGLNIV